MLPENIDYDGLKKRGFLRQKQEGLFVLRTRMTFGVYTKEQLRVLNEISEKHGREIVHVTTRQGLEIPFIKFEDITEVEKILQNAKIEAGTSGPRLRTTTSCPGNNWCKSGLIDTFSLAKRIENGLNIKCGMDLPHKFKISISGCPNTCTRPQASEIGIHGQIDASGPDRRIGYIVYLGGCGGRTPRIGFKVDKIFTEEEVISLIERVVSFFKNNARPKQRLALLIEEIGREKFLSETGLDKNLC